MARTRIRPKEPNTRNIRTDSEIHSPSNAIRRHSSESSHIHTERSASPQYRQRADVSSSHTVRRLQNPGRSTQAPGSTAQGERNVQQPGSGTVAQKSAQQNAAAKAPQANGAKGPSAAHDAKATLRINPRQKQIAETGAGRSASLSSNRLTKISKENTAASSKMHGRQRLFIEQNGIKGAKGAKGASGTSGGASASGTKAGKATFGKGGAAGSAAGRPSAFSRVGSSIKSFASNIGTKLKATGGRALPVALSATVALGTAGVTEAEGFIGNLSMIPAAAQYYMTGEEPSNDEMAEIRRHVAEGSSYTERTNPNDHTLISQYALDAMITKQEERGREAQTDTSRTPVEITLNGVKLSLDEIRGGHYMDFTAPHTYVGAPSNPDSAPVVRFDKPQFSRVPRAERDRGSISVRYVSGNHSVTQVYYRETQTAQYLGEAPVELASFQREGKNLIGWSFTAGSQTPDFYVYQHIDDITYRLLKSRKSNGRVTLYPVFASNKTAVREDRVRVINEQEIEQFAAFFNPEDLTVQYAYLDEEGNVAYRSDNENTRNEYSPNELYKAILAMATVATCNTSEHGREYVEYCKRMMDLAFGSANTYSVAYNVRQFRGDGAGEQYSWSQNGMTYTGSNARLTCQVTVYVNPSAESLMSQDESTGRDIYVERKSVVQTIADQNGMGDIITGTARDIINWFSQFTTRVEVEVPCPFVGWTEENKEVVREYMKKTDEEFREMFNIVFPPVHVYMSGNMPAAIMFNKLINEGYTVSAALAVVGSMDMITNHFDQRYEQWGSDGRLYVGIARADIDELNNFAAQYSEHWTPGTGGVSVRTQVEFLLQRMQERWSGEIDEAHPELNTYLQEYESSYVFMGLDQFKALRDSVQATVAFRACYLQLPLDQQMIDATLHKIEEYREKVVYGIGGGDASALVEYALRMADNPRHGYSNGSTGRSRMGPDYDCSSFLCYCMTQCGMGLDEWAGYLPGPSWMYTSMLASGYWTEIPFTGINDLMPGDMLFLEPMMNTHVEMYIGNGLNVGAHSDYDGVTGDSANNEISVGSPWFTPTNVLRLTVAYGDALDVGDGTLRWPLPEPYGPGYITSWFGHRVLNGQDDYHNGLDIGVPLNTQILAAADGVAVISQDGYNGGCGNYVILYHGGDLYTIYMHMNSRAISPGDNVRAGQVIGYAGTTGYSFGVHLHFGVCRSDHGYDGSCVVDPAPLLGIRR